MQKKTEAEENHEDIDNSRTHRKAETHVGDYVTRKQSRPWTKTGTKKQLSGKGTAAKDDSPLSVRSNNNEQEKIYIQVTTVAGVE